MSDQAAAKVQFRSKPNRRLRTTASVAFAAWQGKACRDGERMLHQRGVKSECRFCPAKREFAYYMLLPMLRIAASTGRSAACSMAMDGPRSALGRCAQEKRSESASRVICATGAKISIALSEISGLALSTEPALIGGAGSYSIKSCVVSATSDP